MYLKKRNRTSSIFFLSPVNVNERALNKQENTHRFSFKIIMMVIINSRITVLNMELLNSDTHFETGSATGLKTDFTAPRVFRGDRSVPDIQERVPTDVCPVPLQITGGICHHVSVTALTIRESYWNKRRLRDLGNIVIYIFD